MTAFLINLGLGMINLWIGKKPNLFLAGWCFGIALVLLAGYFGWISDNTLIFMGMKGE